MNQLQVFSNNEFGQVRTLTIENEPWFVGKDVAEILGYSNSSDAIRTHIDDEDKRQIGFHDLQNINQKMLANAIGKSESSVSQYLSGKISPNVETTNKIADFLGCDVNDLLNEVETVISTDIKNVSVEEAAKRLGKPPQFIRLALQQGNVPFGFAAKGESRWSYHISLKKLNEYIGGDI